VTTTNRWRARGYNYHIRAANDNYVAERILNGALAQHIVSAVNGLQVAVSVDISELHRLKRDVDDICQALDPNQIGGAVNWADLGAREVARVFDSDGNTWLRVVIEEASPGEDRLIVPVRDALKARGWDIDHIEVATEW
jgi:hypothetical protein